VTEIDPKLSQIYREAARENPPAALDAAILAAARRQAAQPKRPARSSWVRWMAPASALATLVVAVSLAFLMERERPEATRDMSIHPIAPRPGSAPPASVTESAKAKAAGNAAPAEPASMDAPAAAGGAAAEAALKKEAAVAPGPAPATSLPAPAAPAPAPAPAAPAQAPAPQPAEAARSDAQAFPAERRAKAAESGLSAPKAAESKTMRESNVAGDSAPGAAGAAAGAAGVAARTAPAAAPPAAAGKLAPLRQEAAQRSPEAWLEEISRLKREGRDKEAAEQLAEFRKAYPAYALPESLRYLQQ